MAVADAEGFTALAESAKQHLKSAPVAQPKPAA
jgi:hypothetical protein